MSRFIQLHLLTFYPPSNPNRDDTGRPKTAQVGGAERLRISSQALKRAVRTSDIFHDRLESHLGERTQRLGEEIRKDLVGSGVEESRAGEIAKTIAAAFGKLEDAKGRNQTYIKQLAFISVQEREAALALARRAAQGEAIEEDTKKLAQSLLRKTDTAVDIAMFGRMLADNADFNREAAVQVAHAFTTNRITIEDDFYTAVDDLKEPSEDAGAGFVGELGFGSGVFYLYVCIDTRLLVSNLGGDGDLAARALRALVEALAQVVPGGKLASFANRARAEYVLAERGDQQPRSLASAFLRPVSSEDLMLKSIEVLEGQRDALDRAYAACADESRTMNVRKSEGSLAEIAEFVGAPL